MVLMRMRDDDRLQVAALFGQKGDIGQNQIYAGQFRAGEGHAAIDHDPLAVAWPSITVKAEIHAYFADAAERQEHQFFILRHVVMRLCFFQSSKKYVARRNGLRRAGTRVE